MDFSLDNRSCRLGVGEFSAFTLGPRDSEGGPHGVWRAQLGTHWHQQLRAQTIASGVTASFEAAIEGQVFHRGWTVTLSGRIDQLVHDAGAVVLREIKTVTQPLPADESDLRTDYLAYFIQVATYANLWRLAPRAVASPGDFPGATASAAPAMCPELVFVEAGSGLAQTIPITSADDGLFRAQLDRLVEFLDLRDRARQRLRTLRFRPAFAQPRPGQETTLVELTQSFSSRPLVFFEAPTGFGKTGVLLEFALGQLRSGHFDRVLYLTSKSTGQLQVVRQLAAMTVATPVEAEQSPATTPSRRAELPTPVAAWHVRNKGEHCVNHVFNCTREACGYLNGAEGRWPKSGLSRFYLAEHEASDIVSLRTAGRAAQICPYEITRAALAFNDAWIGDYNYVFSPRNRGLFYDQAGFDPARSLLLVDEAHNLPTRVADVYSHAFSALAAATVASELHRVRPPGQFMALWDQWTHLLHGLRPSDALSLHDEDDARHVLGELATAVANTPLDYSTLAPGVAEQLWEVSAVAGELAAIDLPRLWWCPRAGELVLTCLDAAAAIGSTLREFGGVVLASATFGPPGTFASACGLAELQREAVPAGMPVDVPERLGVLNKRDTRKLYAQLTSAAKLLQVEEAHAAASPCLLRAATPWRDGAYDVAVDARVDTTFHQRAHHYRTTATTVEALQAAAQRVAGEPGAIAVFFPSYAYAEAIQRTLAASESATRVALQPKLSDLAAQAAWVEDSLGNGAALFLVLGSSFAESIDHLGGRVTHAMVVGPALPEVNAVQRARLAICTRPGPAGEPALGREAAFGRVYQVPGMTKVNQALGRLVRAPGQNARVLLHCRRFLEASYHDLLAPEYQRGTNLVEDDDLSAWLELGR